MKKLSLLILMGCVSLSIFAQMKNAAEISFQKQTGREPVIRNENKSKFSKYQSMAFAKTTASPFITFDFSGGTPSTLPTGWTAGTDGSVPQGATWEWHDVACTGAFNIGTINSTTAANGWLVYDADSIGAANPTVAPVEGWVQSPSVDCSTHPSVQISFEQYFAKYNDSCFVDVSNDNGITWDVYPVTQNNALAANMSLPNNPTTTYINITATAAGQQSVIFRFRSKYFTASGAHNWLIDDVALSELDSVEVNIHGRGVLLKTVLGDTTSFGSIPLYLTEDSLLSVVFLGNNTPDTLSNVAVTQTIYQDTTLLRTQTKTIASFANNTFDDPVWFDSYSLWQNNYPYIRIGDYSIGYFANSTSKVDTTFFTVSDSFCHRYGGAIQGDYIIHNAPDTANGIPERSFQVGTFFDLGNTSASYSSWGLVGVYAAFSSNTTVGSTVRAIVYEEVAQGVWHRIKISSQKTLHAYDISTPNNVVFTRINIGTTYFPLNHYVVVVCPDNLSSTDNVSLLAAENAGSDMMDLVVGVADTSTNNPVQNNFVLGRISNSPLIKIAIDIIHGIEQINVVQVADAYPNPAKSEINIPFITNVSASVNVRISNAIGTAMAIKDMGKMNAKQKGVATFNVSNYASGIYFYTVEANGATQTKRFVVLP